VEDVVPPEDAVHQEVDVVHQVGVEPEVEEAAPEVVPTLFWSLIVMPAFSSPKEKNTSS